MLFTLGVGSASSLAGCVITVINDDFPQWKKWKITAVVSVIGFACGLVYVTPVSLIDLFLFRINKQTQPTEFTFVKSGHTLSGQCTLS